MKMAALGVICLIFFAANSVEAYTIRNDRMPVMQTTVTQNGDTTTVNYSRPVMYAGSKMVKRPPYYKECKRKLGYWDEYLCAQIYMPKLIEEKFGDVE
ncbi:MAG: hypothetical protein NC390_00605 [Fusobacterium sp.]|nr:hypothetical protein [Fusobacterium sp.]